LEHRSNRAAGHARRRESRGRRRNQISGNEAGRTNRSIVRGDRDEYEKHLAFDYLLTRDNGHVESKDEALVSLRDVKRKIIVMEMEPADVAIRIYGDTAVSNAEFTTSVRESGQVKTRRTRQTDVFVKRDGQWHLIAEQGTMIGK
jgi:hypothetical protein